MKTRSLASTSGKNTASLLTNNDPFAAAAAGSIWSPTIAGTALPSTVVATPSTTISSQQQNNVHITDSSNIIRVFRDRPTSDSEDEMADHTLISNFAGEGQNVLEWIKSFENYAAFKRYDGPTRLAYFKLKLTSLAKSWLDCLDDTILDDEKELIKAFIERFQTTEITKHKLIRDIFAVKQKPYESVDSYLANISRIAQQCQLGEEITMNAATLGLKPTIASYVLESKPTSMSDIYKYARVAEVTRQIVPDESDGLQSQMLSFGQQLAEVSSKLSQLTTAAVQAKEEPSTPKPSSKAQYNGGQYRKRGDGAFKGPQKPYRAPQYNTWAAPAPPFAPNPYMGQYAAQNNHFEPQFNGPQGMTVSNQEGSTYQPPRNHTTNLQQGRQASGAVRRCFICNRTSHIARECWYRPNQA